MDNDPLSPDLVYKIVSADDAREALASGVYAGAPIDRADGFIHLSSADQVAGTLALHFAGQDDLVLFGLDPTVFGPALRWERSRGGALFPHLYGTITVSARTPTWRAVLVDGRHRIVCGR